MNNAVKPGKAQVERIQKALEALMYNKVEIAAILLKLEEAILESIGKEYFEMIPEDKQKEAELYIRNRESVDKFMSLLPKISREELNAKIEARFEKVAVKFEQTVSDAEKIEANLSELAKTSPSAKSNGETTDGNAPDQSPAHTVKNTFSNLWKKAT